MWEYRLTWTEQPGWWDEAWQNGLALVPTRVKYATEGRSDTYLVLADRLDIGLKLRGGSSGGFDLKVLHRRSGGWELWEKIVVTAWDDLERQRVAAALRVALTAAEPATTDAWRILVDVLAGSGLRGPQVVTGKKRIQTDAGRLMAKAGYSGSAGWLAELAEITLPGRAAPLWSLCLESLDPLAGGIEVARLDGAMCCGYPELLARHVAGTL